MNANSPSPEAPLRTDLLDELFRHVRCAFLSDLPQRENWKAIHQALQEIEPRDFTVKSWEEAALYLCGSEKTFTTPGQARDYLLQLTGQS